MSRVTVDDQLKFLLSCVRHSSYGRIDFIEVASECGIVSKGAAAKRYERLFRSIDNLPNNTKLAPTPTPKQKSKATIAKEAAAKRRKIEGDAYDMQDDEYDDEEYIKREIVKTEAQPSRLIKSEYNDIQMLPQIDTSSQTTSMSQDIPTYTIHRNESPYDLSQPYPSIETQPHLHYNNSNHHPSSQYPFTESHLFSPLPHHAPLGHSTLPNPNPNPDPTNHLPVLPPPTPYSSNPNTPRIKIEQNHTSEIDLSAPPVRAGTYNDSTSSAERIQMNDRVAYPPQSECGGGREYILISD